MVRKLCLSQASVDREAVEQASATDPLQRFWTASRRAMRRIPRSVAAAVAVRVADLSGARRAARPVLTGVVGRIGEGSAIGLRAGQHVVRIGLISDPLLDLALLCNVRLLAHIVAQTRLVQRISV